jgi:hypothetical protein
MSINTKHLLFKVGSTLVPLAAALLFGPLGLIVAGVAICVLGYLVWKEPDPDHGYKLKTLLNLFGYGTLGAGLGLLFILL